MDSSHNGHQLDSVGIADDLDLRNNIPLVGGENIQEKESERRRYHIIRSCLKEGAVSIDGLLQDKPFRRLFKKTSRTTLSEDFKLILGMLGNGQRITRGKSVGTLELVRGQSSFADRGYYAAESDAGDEGDPATSEKWLIGRFIVENLLKSDHEVLYLSTGTTVFQAGLAVLRSAKQNIRVILTDNLAMVELFCQYARRTDHQRPIELRILGGIAGFGNGDIELNKDDFKPLPAWQFSTAVISATAVDPLTGRIFSFRQPQTKEQFFTDCSVAQIVIPVISKKIVTTGGHLIFDPSWPPKDTHRTYHIVTTRLEPPVRQLLERHYTVHETAGQAQPAAALPVENLVK